MMLTPAVEAEARALLRERIERLPWYPGLTARERKARIRRDVEEFWPVMVKEAAWRVVDRVFRQLAACPRQSGESAANEILEATIIYREGGQKRTTEADCDLSQQHRCNLRCCRRYYASLQSQTRDA